MSSKPATAPAEPKPFLVDNVPISKVRPYARNPRINEAAVDKVAASITEFGFRVPIVVDPKHVIVTGHTRYKAALKLGLESVPVHVARGLTAAQVRAYRIADNATAEIAEWDSLLLAEEVAALKEADFDLALLGFGTESLASLVGPDAPVEFPEVGDDIQTDHSCPKCGYKWSGGK